MATRNVTAEEKAECAVVECFRPECASQCGFIKWFGNLSDCYVTLQYQLEEGKIWHSLGTYPPGNQIELGGGVLMLPSSARIRVVEAVAANSTTGSFQEGRVIADWGVVGTGQPTLFVDNSNCRKQGGDTPGTTSPCMTAASPAAPCINKRKPPLWLWLTLLFLAIVAVALAFSGQYLCRLRQKYNRMT
jgi:hypothetical protein